MVSRSFQYVQLLKHTRGYDGMKVLNDKITQAAHIFREESEARCTAAEEISEEPCIEYQA